MINTKKNLLILVILLLTLLFVFFAAKQRQEVRKKAQGVRQEIDLYMLPQTAIVSPSSKFIQVIKLKNLQSSLKLISGAQVTLRLGNNSLYFVNNSQFTVCQPPFDQGLKSITINGQDITIMCTTAIDAAPINLGDVEIIDFAHVEIGVIANPVLGPTNISFVSTKVIEAGSVNTGAIDISTGGQTTNVTIVDYTLTPTVTPEVTNVPRPTCSGLTINNTSSVTASVGQTISLRVNGVQNTDRVAFGATQASNPQCATVPGGTISFGTLDAPQADWIINYTIPASMNGQTYTVYANPATFDPFYVCTSNPAANSGNNYCGGSIACNCRATLIVQETIITPTLTPTPPTNNTCSCDSNQVNIDNCVSPNIPVCVSYTSCLCQTPTQPPQPTNTTVPTQPPQPTATIPPTCTRKAEGDANCDGRINGIDLGILILYQCIKTNPAQVCSDLRADFNSNGEVDAQDRLTVINHLE